MVTGELKRRIDALWLEFWQGGITNPLTVIEQITFNNAPSTFVQGPNNNG